MKQYVTNAIDIIFGVKYIGSGLASDVFLFNVAILYGVTILAVPSKLFATSALFDLAWGGWGRWLAVPFLIKATLTGTGIIMAIMEKRYARLFRFSGAVVGSIIWYWFIAKYLFVGEILALGFPFSIVGAAFSLRILAISWANLPRQESL